MHGGPLPLLARAYGLAGATALVGLALGALGPVSAGLIIWLGGAVAAIGLGLLARRPPPIADTAAEDEALAEALRAWEADRLADIGKAHAEPRSAAQGR